MAEPALEVSGLEVRYGGVAAVRGLTLRLERGEIVGLIGPNGAGKSTTLHAIMGVVRPLPATFDWPAAPFAGAGRSASRAPASRSCPKGGGSIRT